MRLRYYRHFAFSIELIRSSGDPSFVGPRLRDDKEFCLRVTEELSAPDLLPDLGWNDQQPELRRLLDLSD